MTKLKDGKYLIEISNYENLREILKLINYNRSMNMFERIKSEGIKEGELIVRLDIVNSKVFDWAYSDCHYYKEEKNFYQNYTSILDEDFLKKKRIINASSFLNPRL